MRKSNIIISLFFVLLAQTAYGAGESYYVTQSGAGSHNGLSVGNAWSVSEFNTTANWSNSDNSAKIDPGDTVYLSGNITASLIIRGSGTTENYITIDGTNAQILSPVSTVGKLIDVHNVQYLLFKNLYIDGQDSTMTSDANLAAIYVRQLGSPTGHITIQDSTIKNSGSGLLLQGFVSNVLVVRNTFENMIGNGVGVYFDNYDSDTDYLYNDCPNYITIGGSRTNGNTFKNVGKLRDVITAGAVPGCALGTLGTDIIFSYNHVYSNITDVGAGIYLNGAKRVLVEYNSFHGLQAVKHRPPIEFKCDPLVSDGQLYFTEDIVIRFNKIYDIYNGPNLYAPPASSIRISGRGSNRIVHGNYSEGAGIDLNWNWAVENEGLGGTGYFVWANIVNGSQTSAGINITGISLNTDNFTNWYILNNTIYRTLQDDKNAQSPSYEYGISTVPAALTVVKNLNIKNNVVVNSRPNSNEYINYSVPNSAETHFDYNHTYFTGQVPKIKLISSGGITNYTWNSLSLPAGFTGHNTEGDPKFIAGDSGNFALLMGSPCIDSGSNLSDADSALPTIKIQGQLLTFSFSTALNPISTNWSTILPTVVTENQNNYGNWEKGAYVFVTNTLDSPKSLKTVDVIK